jgi:hypothetical protein
MRPFLVEIRPYPHHYADSANGGRRRDPRASARLDASFLAWLPLSSKQRWYVVHSQPQVRYKRPSSRLTGNFEFFCYFVVLDVTKDRWRSINGTLGVDHILTLGVDHILLGVDHILMCGGNPHTVPTGLVEGLMQAPGRNRAL